MSEELPERAKILKEFGLTPQDFSPVTWTKMKSLLEAMVKERKTIDETTLLEKLRDDDLAHKTAFCGNGGVHTPASCQTCLDRAYGIEDYREVLDP